MSLFSPPYEFIDFRRKGPLYGRRHRHFLLVIGFGHEAPVLRKIEQITKKIPRKLVGIKDLKEKKKNPNTNKGTCLSPPIHKILRYAIHYTR